MSKNEVQYTDFGYQPDFVRGYRDTIRRGVPKTLNVHVYQGNGPGPSPLVVCFHAGGFRTGRIVHGDHRAIARWLTKSNISVAFPEYRLGAKRSDLSESTRSRMDELEALAISGFPARFRRSEALAALEDACALLVWLEANRNEFNFSGKLVLAGGSAGAITALNVLYLAPHLGLSVPEIGGAICYSGGFAFPSLADTVDTPVFAIHGPEDDRVPMHSIVELSKRNPAVSLLVSNEHSHGSLKLYPGEAKKDTYGRLISKVNEFS